MNFSNTVKALFIVLANSALGLPDGYDQLTVVFERETNVQAPELVLAIESEIEADGMRRVVLPAFEKGHDTIKFVVDVPSAAQKVALFVDGEFKCTFKKSCAKEDPMWGPIVKFTVLHEIVEAARDLNSTANSPLRLELSDKITGLYKELATFNAACFYGQFAVFIPQPIDPDSWSAWLGYRNKMKVVNGGMYAVRVLSEDTPVIQVRM